MKYEEMRKMLEGATWLAKISGWVSAHVEAFRNDLTIVIIHDGTLSATDKKKIAIEFGGFPLRFEKQEKVKLHENG